MTRAVLVLWVTIATCPAWADDIPASRPVQAAPLSQGDPAPFDGVLLTPERLEAYLRQELDLVEARELSAAKDKALVALEGDLAKEKTRADQAGKGSSFWWGVGAGVALTALAVYGGARLVK